LFPAKVSVASPAVARDRAPLPSEITPENVVDEIASAVSVVAAPLSVTKPAASPVRL
jgi:hypothetical protein